MKAAVVRRNRRSNRVAASVESDKSDRMNYCDKQQRSSHGTLIGDEAGVRDDRPIGPIVESNR